MKSRIANAFLLLSIALFILPASAIEKLTFKGGVFLDPKGRRIGLFGTSFDIHSNLWNWWATNWEEVFDNWGKPAIDLVASYGMNVIRLSFAAPFFMPKPGVGPDNPQFQEDFALFEKMAREVWKKDVNLKYGPCGEEYLKFMDKLIHYCGQRGIYVVLDWHQWPDGKEWAWGWWEGISLKEIQEGIVAVWKLLAHRYKAEPAVLGLDIPFNEPTQDWTMDDRTYRSLCERIIKEIRKEAPNKLIFMEPQDWGHHCDVDLVHPVSLWDFPPGVDAVYPHYYLGMHYPNTEREEGYKGWLANWLSWFHKPTAIGEWDPAEGILHGFEPATPEAVARLIDAHLSYFYAQGVQMLNQWAWYGDPWKRKGAETVFKFIPFWKEHPPLSFEEAGAKVALVCNSHYRASYGRTEDFQFLVDELLNCHVVPFKTLFEEQILASSKVLKNFKALIVYTKGMSQEALEKIRHSGVPAFFVEKVEKDKPVGIARFLRGHGIDYDDKTSKELLIGYGWGGFLIFERYGQEGEFEVHPCLPRRGRIVILDYETKEVVAKGSAKEIQERGFKAKLEANRAKLYEWKAED